MMSPATSRRWPGSPLSARSLLATVTQTPAGFASYTWRLASALTCFLDLRGHWQDQKAAHAAGLAAARRHHDPVGQATAYRGLGLAYAGLKQFDDARAHYLLALDLFREAATTPARLRPT